MDVHYPTIDESATSDYVLTVMRDDHRLMCHVGEADPNVLLSLDTTVAEWREACDLLDWRELGHALNQFWCISCSDAEWRRALTPEKEKRLSDVCHLIAAHASRPTIRPATLFGNTCASAGAFLTIRSLLNQAGARAEEIAPSTALAPYARRHLDVFLGAIRRLAPGALPPVRIRMPIYDATVRGLFAGVLCLVIARLAGEPLFTIFGVLVLAVSYLVQLAARGFPPTSVEIGQLKTFRELAQVVARGSQKEVDREMA